MRTAKRVAILLIVALIGMLTIAQESNQSSAPARPPSARTADCLLVITADPGIIPLNIETVASLLYSPAVLGNATTQILGPDAARDPQGLVSIQWLSENGRSTGMQGSRPRAEQGYDDDMKRQLEAVYGRGYANEMSATPETGRRSSPPGLPPAAPQSTTSPRRGTESPYGQRGSYGGSTGGGGGGMMGGGMGGMGGGMMGGGMMGGGMGMGGMGMGGMGMSGMGGFYGTPTGPDRESPAEQRVTIKLTVRLPDNAKPVADLFMRTIAENLQESLNNAYRQHTSGLESLLSLAKSHREEAQERLQGDQALSPGEAKIREQLDQIVDLSALEFGTPIDAAMEILRNSVQPPLPIVVQWNGLNVTVPRHTALGGLHTMRLGTALDLLVKGLPGVAYRVQGDVIVIGPDSLVQGSSLSPTSPQGQVEIRTLAGRKSELMRTVQGLEMELAGMEARRKAIQEQIVQGRELADKQLAEDEVTKELKTLLDLSKMNIEGVQKAVHSGRAPETDLTQAMESMTRAKIELARRREEMMKSAGGGQLEQYNAELSRIAIDKAEKQAQLDVLHRQLGEVQRQLTQASTFDPEAARIRVAQETLDLANRRVAEVQARLTSLQPPSVVILGAN